ncbi:MAG: hypothetical protein RR894_13910 [Terrisporobacter sp.]
MRNNYNSFDYWEGLISENKTIRGHMFMDKSPTNKSLYVHTLIYCRNNGLNNIWGYFPDEQALIGYIQYSFLQEAFYKWIYGKSRLVTKIPNISVSKIISDAEKNKLISKEEVNNMKRHLEMITRCWSLPREKIVLEITRFVRDFNKTWYGDSTEFLYLKVFKTIEDFGEFVVKSSYITSTEEEFKNRIGVSVEEWRAIYSNALVDISVGSKFRDILLKSLTEVI